MRNEQINRYKQSKLVEYKITKTKQREIYEYNKEKKNEEQWESE